MYPTLTNFTQGKRKTYDANDLSALSLVSIIVYIYSFGKKFYWTYLKTTKHEMETFSGENGPTTCKNVEKKEKTCEGLFNSFNRWYENKEKMNLFIAHRVS